MEIKNYRRDYEVDILIRGHKNIALTNRCLESIARNTDLDRVMVTYVDNGSWATDDDGDPGELKSFFVDPLVDSLEYMGLKGSFQLVALPFNHGSVRAINCGLALSFLSPAPYVLLMDNDTEIPDGDTTWLDRWLEYFQDEEVGAAGAVTDYVAGFQHVDAVPDKYMRDWKVEGQGQGFKEVPIPVLVSFAMMMRKSACLKVGGFDEQFEPKNFEDYDYTLRLREAGFKLVVANSVWVHHRGQNKTTAMQSQSMADNSIKFRAKWGDAKLRGMGVNLG